METIGLSIPEILKYGVIGFGVVLGIFSAFLLSKEQSREVPRRRILRSIYLLTALSLLVFASGILIHREPAAMALTATTNPYRLTQNLQDDDLILGTWKGSGADFKNYGQKNPLTDGYHYEDLTFEFTSGTTRNTILLHGDFSARQKSATTLKAMPRKITGECSRDGKFLIINYKIPPLKNDQDQGMGVMMFDFKASGDSATGFFVSRSAITGGLVCGEINLKKERSK